MRWTLKKVSIASLVVASAIFLCSADASASGSFGGSGGWGSGGSSGGSWGSGGSSGGSSGWGSGGSSGGSAGRPGLFARIGARMSTLRANAAARRAGRSFGSGGSSGGSSGWTTSRRSYSSGGSGGSTGVYYSSYSSSGSGGGSGGVSYATPVYSAPVMSSPVISSPPYPIAPAIDSSPIHLSTPVEHSVPVDSGIPIDSSTPIDFGTPIQSNPTPPRPQPIPEVDASRTDAVLKIVVPEDAIVFINNKRTKTKGTERKYVSRNLKPGFKYSYEVRAEIVRNGKTETKTEVFDLRAGQVKEAFDFAFDSVQPVVTTLTLNVPENAKVTLGGVETSATGTKRVFSTKKLAKGQSWDNYKIVVSVENEGRTLSTSKTVTISAGDEFEHEFVFDGSEIAAR